MAGERRCDQYAVFKGTEESVSKIKIDNYEGWEFPPLNP